MELSKSNKEVGQQKGANADETISPYLRLLYAEKNFFLDATDGTENFAQAKDAFTWIGTSFRQLGLNVPGKPAEKKQAQVHGIIKDGTFAHFYGSISQNLEVLRIHEHQAKNFMKEHKDEICSNGVVTFILFTRGDELVKEDRSNLFVASVSGDDGVLESCAYKFSFDKVWLGNDKYQLLLPKRKS